MGIGMAGRLTKGRGRGERGRQALRACWGMVNFRTDSAKRLEGGTI
jgi:hypothetical protein